jgi:hypothetical protein
MVRLSVETCLLAHIYVFAYLFIQLISLYVSVEQFNTHPNPNSVPRRNRAFL